MQDVTYTISQSSSVRQTPAPASGNWMNDACSTGCLPRLVSCPHLLWVFLGAVKYCVTPESFLVWG